MRPIPPVRGISPFWLALLAACFGAISTHAQLRTAVEVRSLSAEEADQGLEVEITGTVIFSDPPSTIFIQDETAGTFFRLGKAAPPVPGDEVLVRGKTQSGLYLPGIEESTFQLLRHVGVPEALPATYDDLMSGRYHYQRVAIEGLVRTVTPELESTTVIRVAMGSRIVEARIQQPPGETNLVDSRVKVTGLAAGHINARRQLVAPYLRCTDWSEVEVLTPPQSVARIPAVSSQQLLNFRVEGHAGHRVRVAGTVLARFPRGELFLRDEESAIGVKLLQPESGLNIGDFVEVIGFPEMERFSASVVDAEITLLEPGDEPPAPTPVNLQRLMEGSEDGNLVVVEANLSDAYRTEEGGVLLLQVGNRTLQALAPRLSDSLVPGMQVRVAGICQVETTRGTEYRSSPESVLLRVRNDRDITILRAPSWWTARRLASLLFLTLGIVFVAGLWIVLLRRQVATQTVALRHRIEHEAALEERQRIAREFHDTLEQELAGLSLRLDAATAKGVEGKLKGLLEGSRSLVTRIQTETRNLISDLRDTSKDGTNLEAALRDLVTQLPPDVGPRMHLEIDTSSPLPPLPTRTVHHLKMMGREAVTNAIKHAGAERIELRVTMEEQALILRIIDDGLGFDSEAETHGQVSHFGCMGIRERCAKLDARVQWKSEPGKGTIVEICLPLNSEA